MCCTSLQVSEGLRKKKGQTENHYPIITRSYLLNWPACMDFVCVEEGGGRCLLGVQSESDDACGHGGGEGGLGFSPAAALPWTQRCLSRTPDLFSFNN